jgi:hypothetical protein
VPISAKQQRAGSRRRSASASATGSATYLETLRALSHDKDVLAAADRAEQDEARESGKGGAAK